MNLSIVNNHNWAFDCWKDSGIQNATLVHVDAHPDMLGQCASKDISSSSLDIASFILPAFHSGIIDRILWLNPQSEGVNTLLKLGCKETGDLLSAENAGVIDWVESRGRSVGDIEQGIGESIDFGSISDIVGQTQIILDIDLDAFACQKQNTIYNPSSSSGVIGWEKRLLLLNELNDIVPSIVTVAESQGLGGFTPPDLVPIITHRVIEAIS